MMAHERGQADVEAGISMREWGWLAWKKRDAVRCPKCGTIVLPAGKSGTWDFPEVQVPYWRGEYTTLILAIEVKAGQTSFAFNNLREDQRQWAEGNDDKEHWIWLCLGKGAVNAPKSPRRTYFLPYGVFLAIEGGLSAKRKSIPYSYPMLDKWELKWEGHKTWSVPTKHPARMAYIIYRRQNGQDAD